MILTRFERATLSHCDERRRKYLLRMKSRKEMIQKNRMRTIKKRLSLLRRRLREESKFFFFFPLEQFVGLLGGASRWPIRATMISIRGHRATPGKFGISGRAQSE